VGTTTVSKNPPYGFFKWYGFADAEMAYGWRDLRQVDAGFNGRGIGLLDTLTRYMGEHGYHVGKLFDVNGTRAAHIVGKFNLHILV